MEGLVFIAGSSFIWFVGGHRLVRQQQNKQYLNAHDPLQGDFHRNPEFIINSWTQRPTKETAQIVDGTGSLFTNNEFKVKHNEMLMKAKVNNPIPFVSPYHGAGVDRTPQWQSHLHGYETDAPRPMEWIGLKNTVRPQYMPTNVMVH